MRLETKGTSGKVDGGGSPYTIDRSTELLDEEHEKRLPPLA